MEKGIPSRIYKDYILELYNSPKNFGSLKNPSYKITEYNSLCGDEITLYLLIKNGKIKNAKFSGSGCVISIIFASKLVEKIKGMNLTDIQKIRKKDVLKFFKIKLNVSREKCALLSFEALKKILNL